MARQAQKRSFFDKLRIQQSYTSLILGIIVVVIVAVLVIGLVRRGAGVLPTIAPGDAPQTANEEQKTGELPTTYEAVEGDTLWSISEKYYKTGYNWMDIASENKLENPNVLAVGTKLSIPKVEAKTMEAEVTPTPAAPEVVAQPDTNAISTNEYTVVQDDNLWMIAVRSYGDGFRWVDIAKANNLVNPNIIHPGNKLVLPR